LAPLLFISTYATDPADMNIWLYGSCQQITETEECLQFGADQIVPMGLVQPAPAVIYDYYSPGHQTLWTEHFIDNTFEYEHWL